MRKAIGKIIPQSVTGPIRRRKDAVMGLLMGLFILAPWVRWPRGADVSNQAILMDIAHRRIFWGPLELWPNELYVLMGLLMIGAFGLFAITSWFGRLWCGFTCPQTVWTDLFLKIERFFEGDRNQQLRTEKQGTWSKERLLRKIGKHGAWLAVACGTSASWLFYFNDAPTALMALITGQASSKLYGFLALFTATTYALGGFAREKVCLHMCPWPRFQSAMLDPQSLIVSYQSWRGEPRGHAKAAERTDKGLGDCVDCGQCVAVCPMGIDIRDGLQLDCIGCGLCVDACNNIMEKIGSPKDLILFDCLSHQEALNRHEPAPAFSWKTFQWCRPRPIIYSTMALTVAFIVGFFLMRRPMVELRVEQIRAPLVVTLKDGSLRNGYVIGLQNKYHVDYSVTLTSNFEGTSLSTTGQIEDAKPSLVLHIAPRQRLQEKVFVHRAATTAHNTRVTGQNVQLAHRPFFFMIDHAHGQTRHAAQFHAPAGTGP